MDKKEYTFLPEGSRVDPFKIIQAMGGGTGITAIFVASSFFISICYNAVYFFILYIDINRIPLCLSDYIMSFGSWFNVLLYIFSYVYIIYMIEKYSEEIRDDYVNIYSWNRILILFFVKLFSLIIFSVVILIFSYIWCKDFFYNTTMYFFVNISFLFIIMTIIYRKHITLFLIFFILFIISSLVVCSLISLKYSFDLNNSRINVGYNVLRCFEKGILIYSYQDDKILFLCNDGKKIAYACPEYLKIYDMGNRKNEFRGKLAK